MPMYIFTNRNFKKLWVSDITTASLVNSLNVGIIIALNHAIVNVSVYVRVRESPSDL
jgi:hypothetical protein